MVSATVERLFDLLYGELHRLAHDKLRGSPMTLLNTTSLVHECWERMKRANKIAAREKGQFLAYASRAMRSILVDHARSRLSERRGAGAPHLDLDHAPERPFEDEQIVRVHEALQELEAHDPPLAQIVEMKYFAGLSDAEIAGALGVTDRTVRRRFEKARILLMAAMR